MFKYCNFWQNNLNVHVSCLPKYEQNIIFMRNIITHQQAVHVHWAALGPCWFLRCALWQTWTWLGPWEPWSSCCTPLGTSPQSVEMEHLYEISKYDICIHLHPDILCIWMPSMCTLCDFVILFHTRVKQKTKFLSRSFFIKTYTINTLLHVILGIPWKWFLWIRKKKSPLAPIPHNIHIFIRSSFIPTCTCTCSMTKAINLSIYISNIQLTTVSQFP